MYNIFEIIGLSLIMLFRIVLVVISLLLLQLVTYQLSNKKINIYKSINKFITFLLSF